jgi:hypothetical protein
MKQAPARVGVTGVVVAVLLAYGPAVGQTGGGYDLSRNVIAGGGATFSTGGNLSLGGTAGQGGCGKARGLVVYRVRRLLGCPPVGSDGYTDADQRANADEHTDQYPD